MYGGLAITRSTVPSSSGSAVGHVAEHAARRRCRPGCARPRRAASGRARPRGPRRPAPPSAMALAIAPDPVHRSTTTAGVPAGQLGRSRSIAQPVITSVSGRGTKTPGPTVQLDVPEVGPCRSGAAAGPGRPRRRSAPRSARTWSTVELGRAAGSRTSVEPPATQAEQASARRAPPDSPPRPAAAASVAAGQQRADDRRAHTAPIARRPAASRSAVSASCSASTTACRSPFSTASRL